MLNATQQELVASNTGLVNGVLKKLMWHQDYEDLRSEGYLGLCYAAERWDPDQGIAFSTYATTYIRGYVTDYLNRACQGPMRPYYKRINGKQVPTLPEFFYFDKPLEGDGRYEEDSWYDKIPDDSFVAMESRIILTDLRQKLTERFGDRDADIYFLRYSGFGLSELGRFYEVSKTRIGQIVEKVDDYVHSFYERKVS